MKHQSLFFTIVFLLGFCFCAFSQPIACEMHEMDELGISFNKLDMDYKRTFHSDTALVAFNKDEEYKQMIAAYYKLTQEIGKFFKENNFLWFKDVECFLIIYFNETGAIDYLIYRFKINKGLESNERQKEFNRILNEFIKDYKIAIPKKVKFMQSSPVIFVKDGKK